MDNNELNNQNNMNVGEQPVQPVSDSIPEMVSSPVQEQSVTTISSTQPPITEIVSEPKPMNMTEQFQQEMNNKEIQPPKKSNKTIIIILLIIVLCVGGFLLYKFIIAPDKGNSPAPSSDKQNSDVVTDDKKDDTTKTNNSKKVSASFVKANGVSGNNNFVVPTGISQDVAVVKAINSKDKSIDYSKASNQISYGDKVTILEGMALISMYDGDVTGVTAESGEFIFKETSDSVSPQEIYFVSLKEITGFKFGTQSPIKWWNKSSNKMESTNVRFIYSIKVVDPVIFMKNYYTSNNLSTINGLNVYDYFFQNELTGSLYSSLSEYSIDNNVRNISSDLNGYAKVLSSTLDEEYHWQQKRGIQLIGLYELEVDFTD